MIAIAIIAAVFLLILLLRVGVTACYNSNGLILQLRIWFVRITIFPQKKTAKVSREKLKKKSKPKDKLATGGSLKEFLELVPAAAKALGRLRRRIVIDELKLHIVFAGEDPAETGINCGRASAVFGAITNLFDSAFRIKKRSFTAGASFLTTKTTVSCKASLSIAVWAIIYIATSFIKSFIRLRIKMIKSRKEVQNNGKTASNIGLDADNNGKNP